MNVTFFKIFLTSLLGSGRMADTLLLVFTAFILLIALLLFFFSRRPVMARLEWNERFMADAEKIKTPDMDHLAKLEEIAQKNKDEAMERALQKLAQDGEKMYKGRWVPDVRRYFSYPRLIPKRQRSLLAKDAPLSLITIGLLFSLLLLLLFFISGDSSQRSNHLILIPIPFTVALISAVLLSMANGRSRVELQDSLNDLHKTLQSTLPVYDHQSGTAFLIEEFSNYDRRMAASASLLTEKIQDLSDQKLLDTVSGSIEKVLERQIAPALADSNRALSDLCVELTERQAKGMEELAVLFTDKLALTVQEGFSPLKQQLESYNDHLVSAKTGMDMAFSAMQTYQEKASALDNLIQGHLSNLGDQTLLWNKGMARLSEASDIMAAGNDKLSSLLIGSEETLSGRLTQMAEAIHDYGRQNKELFQNLKQENLLLNESLKSAQTESSRILGDYRHLAQQITTAAMDIEKHNAIISENIKGLTENLDHAVKNFATQMQSGVDVTIGDFDQSLAELAERLAHSATAIRDSLARLTDSVQSGGER